MRSLARRSLLPGSSSLLAHLRYPDGIWKKTSRVVPRITGGRFEFLRRISSGHYTAWWLRRLCSFIPSICMTQRWLWARWLRPKSNQVPSMRNWDIRYRPFSHSVPSCSAPHPHQATFSPRRPTPFDPTHLNVPFPKLLFAMRSPGRARRRGRSSFFCTWATNVNKNWFWKRWTATYRLFLSCWWQPVIRLWETQTYWGGSLLWRYTSRMGCRNVCYIKECPRGVIEQCRSGQDSRVFTPTPNSTGYSCSARFLLVVFQEVIPPSPTKQPISLKSNLHKKGKRFKGWHQRYFEIQGKHMYYYKNHTVSLSISKC